MGRQWRFVMVGLLALLTVGFSGTVDGAETGVIDGTISVRTGGGDTIPGDWIRVFVVRDSVPVPKLVPFAPAASKDPAVRERILNAHMDFFKSVQKRLRDPNYLADSTLATSSGTFKFVALPPGRYYVVVTFPSLIGDYKVAWQIPVSVKPGKTVPIRLDQRNMALPSYSRDVSMEAK